MELKCRPHVPPEDKRISDRSTFFFQVIEPEWINFKLGDSFMLKLESSYKKSFPKDQDSGLRSPPNATPFEVEGTFADIALLSFTEQTADVDQRITHVMTMAEEEYDEIWEVLSPCSIATIKAIVAPETSVSGMQHYVFH